jgi:isopropylmalate/homocitrate/citramalate synthase
MTEISDKLWLAVDYQGGNNVDGAVSFGVAWNFAKNVSVIFGYNVFKEKAIAGNNTFTTQLDINIP